jgi:hypothetical protein
MIPAPTFSNHWKPGTSPPKDRKHAEACCEELDTCTQELEVGGSQLESSPGKSIRPYLENPLKQQNVWAMVQVTGTLRSISCNTHTHTHTHTHTRGGEERERKREHVGRYAKVINSRTVHIINVWTESTCAHTAAVSDCWVSQRTTTWYSVLA